MMPVSTNPVPLGHFSLLPTLFGHVAGVLPTPKAFISLSGTHIPQSKPLQSTCQSPLLSPVLTLIFKGSTSIQVLQTWKLRLREWNDVF